VELVSGGVLVVDSVEGDGGTVRALTEHVYREILKLPFLKEKVPKKWAQLRGRVQASYQTPASGPLAGKPVVRKQEAVALLRKAALGLDDAQIWDAVEFCGMLGDAVVHRDVLIPDIQKPIDLLRPILHHQFSESLRRQTQRGDAGPGLLCDEHAVPNFGSLGADLQQSILEWAESLKQDRILLQDLLPHLSCWAGLSEAEREGAVQVLES